MRFIIGTHSFLLDVALSKNWTIEDFRVLNRGYHFGIAFCEGQLLGLSSNNQGLQVFRDGRHDIDSNENNPEILTWQREDIEFHLQSQSTLPANWGDVHQIAMTDHGFYTANTKFNALMYQNHDKDIDHSYHFENKDVDWNHINSVFPAGDQIFAILHNKSRKPSELVVLKHVPEKGFELQNKLPLWHIGCHNVFIDGNYFIYNASQEHSLIVVDLNTGEIIKTINFGGWHTKGMTVTDDYIIVGASEHAPRPERARTRGRLQIIDRNSYEEVASVDLNIPDLPHPVGNINEIRCISGEEKAQWSPNPVILNPKNLEFKYDQKTNILRLKNQLLYPFRRMRKFYYNYQLGGMKSAS